jgi:hypothetical protein
MDRLAENALIEDPPEGKGRRVEVGPVVDRNFAAGGGGTIEQACALRVVQRQWFFHKQVTPGLEGLCGYSQMRIWRGCDVQDIQSFRLQHAMEVGIVTWDPVSNRELFRHQGLGIACGDKPARRHSSEGFDVSIGDLAAPNDANA